MSLQNIIYQLQSATQELKEDNDRAYFKELTEEHVEICALQNYQQQLTEWRLR